MSELKPCPFCGGDAKTEIGYIRCGGNELVMRASVFCVSCGTAKTVKFDAMNISFDDFYKQCFAAEDMWNRRAT